MWKGAAETLNAKPTPMSRIPSRINGFVLVPPVRRCAMSGITVVPAPPYTSAIPYSTKALANPPTRRYFAAASCERKSERAKPHMM